ncbi:unnamed protein product [Gadus morhua 'NCC']
MFYRPQIAMTPVAGTIEMDLNQRPHFKAIASPCFESSADEQAICQHWMTAHLPALTLIITGLHVNSLI